MKIGTPGAAALAGAAALWLVYAGVRDIPVFEGLKEVIRGNKPAPAGTMRGGIIDFNPTQIPLYPSGAGASASAAGATGIDRLVGNAAAAYPVLRKYFPTLIMGGWRAQGSVPNSDHPKGLAIDVMTPNPLVHSQIINVFVRLSGAKYWISMGRKASAPDWKIHAYTGPSPHTDHVHLSFS